MLKNKKMIKLMFKKENKFIAFVLENRVVYTIIERIVLPYFPLNLMEVEKKIMMSRNKIPRNMIYLYQLPKVDIDEFNNAKTDEEFTEIIKRDAKKQGAILVK